jgi:sialate O-acetylesterase
MRFRCLSLLAVAGTAGLAPPAPAAPQPAPLFQDHAVLQRDKPMPVWGRADPGEHVVVSFGGQAVGATAGLDGRWIAVLAPLAAASEGTDLTIAGRTTVVVHDVVVGEVWLCAGQDNMLFPVDGGPGARVEDAVAEVASARHPLIREYLVEEAASPVPVAAALGDWTRCSPGTVGFFTAVGYFFARDLQSRLGVPIGIIDSCQAKTPLEAWMSPLALAAFPGIVRGRTAPGATPASSGWLPASVYNGMIDPLAPFALRGILWYQGESDVGRAADYAAHFPAMIAAWRSHFGQGDIPFFWVQLANFKSAATGPGEPWAFLREAQAKALALPMTGQAVAVDLGDARDMRPRGKQEVGRRLALIAKAEVYSIPVDYSGPVYRGLDAEGASLRVRFRFADDGLTAADRPLQSFEVAGADRVFYPAKAAIEADSVIVRSSAVAHPVAVRYAWKNAPEANLYNGAGLPAAPFRSDDW